MRAGTEMSMFQVRLRTSVRSARENVTMEGRC